MPRTARDPLDVAPLVADLLTPGSDALPLDERLDLVRFIRSHSRDAGLELDRRLLMENDRLRLGLTEAERVQCQLGETLEQLTAKPLHLATLLGTGTRAGKLEATVALGEALRVVGFADSGDAEGLGAGDSVLLAQHQNVILGKAPGELPRAIETATFEGLASDGRLRIRWRDEAMIVAPARRLNVASLESGDQVLWDRGLRLAYERLERPKGEGLFLENTPAEGFDAIGGLDRQIEELKEAFEDHLIYPAMAKEYQHRPPKAALLVGPPGTGKTMLARALANHLKHVAGTSRFVSINPSSLRSKWFGESEERVRELFAQLRRAATADADVPVVVYLDEIDSIASARGEALSRIDDRILNAILAELDGFESRQNVFVLGATNRPDVMDAAAMRFGRLGDWIIRIGLPNQRAAFDILGKHLPSGVPCAAEGSDTRDEAAIRDEILHATIAHLYSPNGGHDVARIMFRDGKQRTIAARDVLSGASLAHIAARARARAFRRAKQSGERGVRLPDLLSAAREELVDTAALLTPGNARHYLTDLPHDVDVVRVDPVRPRVRDPHRYLSVA